jgi:hypothetical protein
MKNLSVLATLLTVGLSVVAMPAADAATSACPSPEAATQPEVEQLRPGMRMVETFSVIGSRGARTPESDTSEFIVRTWTYCGDGFVSRQSVMYAPARRGWVVFDIG